MGEIPFYLIPLLISQDGDGIVTQAEVVAELKSLGFHPTVEATNDFMDGMDNIDFETFVAKSETTEHTEEDIT